MADDDLVSQAGEKAVDRAVNGVANFFAAICMPAAEEFGLLLRDKVTYYRVRNLERIVVKVKAKLGDTQSMQSGNTSPKFLKDVLEEGSWAEDDSLQELWAGLVAGEAIRGDGSDDAVIYTEILKALSSYEARILNLVYGDDRVGSLVRNSSGSESEYFAMDPLEFPVKRILEISPRPLNHIVTHTTHTEILSNPLHHELAFGYVQPQLDSLVRKGLVRGWSRSTLDAQATGVSFEASSVGLDLYMRCTGYSLYPLDAYVLARKHWREQRSAHKK